MTLYCTDDLWMTMAWRPYYRSTAPPVEYEGSIAPLMRPRTPGTYMPGPFLPSPMPHPDIPRDPRVKHQGTHWTNFPPEQQFIPFQQPPPQAMMHPPFHAGHRPPLPTRTDQLQSFIAPPRPQQDVRGHSMPQPLLQSFYMGPQWVQQPPFQTGNVGPGGGMMPGGSPPVALFHHPPPRWVGGGPSSVDQQAGTPVDPFVADWLRVVGSSRKQRLHKQSSMKVPEVRSLLCRVAELLAVLKSHHQQLATLSTDNVTGWMEIMQQVNDNKEELQRLRSRLDSEGLVEHTARKLRNRKIRRERLRAVRRKREVEREERRMRMEQITNEWLMKKRQEELKQKTEKSVQAAASGVLGEVKRKQSDIQYHLKLASALRDLRDFRREASRKKGDAPPVEADDRFSEVQDHLLQLLTWQAVVYEGEEHALRVLMEEEVMEAMASSKTAPQEEKEMADQVERPFDPLAPFRDYYLQAERSVQALVSIRTEWDMYLSPEGAPVPQHPIEPPPPSSVHWAHYCTESNGPHTPK